MREYRKFSDSFKSENQGDAPAKVANSAKVSPTLADLATLADPHPDILQDIEDDFQERAAIMEHDAGMTRAQAEAAAFEDCKVIWLNRRKPL